MHDPASVCRPSVRLLSSSTISKIFSETAWPIKFKYYVEHPWIGRMKVSSQDLGYTTKMAATPIYAKIPSKFFFSRTSGPISTKFCLLHLGHQPIIVCSNDDPWMTSTCFTAMSTFEMGKKRKQINGYFGNCCSLRLESC